MNKLHYLLSAALCVLATNVGFASEEQSVVQKESAQPSSFAAKMAKTSIGSVVAGGVTGCIGQAFHKASGASAWHFNNNANQFPPVKIEYPTNHYPENLLRYYYSRIAHNALRASATALSPFYSAFQLVNVPKIHAKDYMKILYESKNPKIDHNVRLHLEYQLRNVKFKCAYDMAQASRAAGLIVAPVVAYHAAQKLYPHLKPYQDQQPDENN